MKRNRIIYHSLLYVLAATLLCGCGIYKAYERPDDIQELASSPLYRQDGLIADTTLPTSVPDSSHFGLNPWEEVYTDPYLQELIRKGLDSNFDLRNAILQVRQMQAQVFQARAAYTPGLQVGYGYGLNYDLLGNTIFSNATSGSTGGINTFHTLSASASWEIDLFGKILNGKRAAVANLLASEAAKASVRTQIIVSIAEAYYSLLALDQQLAISTQTLSNWDKSILMMEAMVSAGSYNQAAVEQAKANSSAVKAQIPEIKRNIRELENSLCLLLGMPAQKIERGSLEDQQLPRDPKAGLPSQLLVNRPDVMQAEAILMNAYALTAQARSSFFPSFVISADLSTTLASIALPLLQQGSRIAGLKTAKAQQEIAANNFKKTLLTASNEVSNALYQIQASQEKCIYYQQQINSLEKAVEYTTELMKLGNITYLEVLTAQQSLLQAQLSLVNQQQQNLNAASSLYRALGGGSESVAALNSHTPEGVTADNFYTNKSVRKRTKAIEKEVKLLIKQERAERKAERKAKG